jgi:hypothetical protein
MASNRREFLKKAALAGAGAAFYQTLGKGRAWAFAQSPTNLRKFVTSLPGLGPSAKNEIGQYIPLATKHTVNFAGKATDLYNVAVAPFSELMHPDLPGKTSFFGYADLSTFDQKYSAGLFRLSVPTTHASSPSQTWPRVVCSERRLSSATLFGLAGCRSGSCQGARCGGSRC